jgi:hypothetical protein
LPFIEGASSGYGIDVLETYIPHDKLDLVEEVALGMACLMHKIVRRCFIML